ncbi:MAG TPA: PLP-dependent transferase, partial [Rhodanobacteraceae bacterium]|nr:PLP-dependent transferase [Rhodanobacteraceae bacterium]
MRPETLFVHAGAEADAETGAVAPPIHLSTTFVHGPSGERRAGYEYVREGNPTQDRLETALAALEGGAGALAYASGMAAMAGLLDGLPAGSHLIYPSDCYTGLRLLAQEFLPQRGVSASAADMSDPGAVRAAFTAATRCVWLETPSNPLLRISDIAALADLAHAHGALVVCDNTFATPLLQQPLMLGADVVMHSTTKYFGGHSDVQGGALVFARRDAPFEATLHRRHVTGGVL